MDDIEYGIPKIEKPPTLESILNEVSFFKVFVITIKFFCIQLKFILTI